MQVFDGAGFERGDTASLAGAIDALLPAVWRLVRGGFFTRSGETPAEARESPETPEAAGARLYVHGLEHADEAEELAVEAVARLLAPARRRGVRDLEGIRRAALVELRARLLERAERAGRLVTIGAHEEAPPGAEDLDLAIASGGELPGGDRATDASASERAAEAKAIAGELEGALDETTRRVLALRFVEGRSERETASAIGCGVAAVRSREHRIRRHTRHRLKERHPDDRFGRAAIDAVLAGRPERLLAPEITFERIRQRVLRRTFTEEPSPFRIRALWALGAAAIAAVLFVLMLVS